MKKRQVSADDASSQNRTSHEAEGGRRHVFRPSVPSYIGTDDGRRTPRQPDGLARDALAAATSERDFQAAVLDLARLRGWRSFHVRESQGSAHGWPDLILLRRGRMIAAELKSMKGRPTPWQLVWLEDLGQVAGVESHLWRPSDWDDIEQALR